MTEPAKVVPNLKVKPKDLEAAFDQMIYMSTLNMFSWDTQVFRWFLKALKDKLLAK